MKKLILSIALLSLMACTKEDPSAAKVITPGTNTPPPPPAKIITVGVIPSCNCDSNNSYFYRSSIDLQNNKYFASDIGVKELGSWNQYGIKINKPVLVPETLYYKVTATNHNIPFELREKTGYFIVDSAGQTNYVTSGGPVILLPAR